mmetsp:Transcript_10879/g.34666  ORF Transcript_10879/g.34666 Transcript_10879/m.34666 type:complete len:137 (-) Transcript_10879:358-768(-)
MGSCGSTHERRRGDKGAQARFAHPQRAKVHCGTGAAAGGLPARVLAANRAANEALLAQHAAMQRRARHVEAAGCQRGATLEVQTVDGTWAKAVVVDPANNGFVNVRDSAGDRLRVHIASPRIRKNFSFRNLPSHAA